MSIIKSHESGLSKYENYGRLMIKEDAQAALDDLNALEYKMPFFVHSKNKEEIRNNYRFLTGFGPNRTDDTQSDQEDYIGIKLEENRLKNSGLKSKVFCCSSSSHLCHDYSTSRN